LFIEKEVVHGARGHVQDGRMGKRRRGLFPKSPTQPQERPTRFLGLNESPLEKAEVFPGRLPVPH